MFYWRCCTGLCCVVSGEPVCLNLTLVLFVEMLMLWKNVACFCTVALGAALFLYGANYYDATIGYSGVFLVISGLLVGVALRIRAFIRKKEVG